MFMKILDHLEEIFISFLIGAATLITFTAVAHRYLASSNWIPSEAAQDWLIQLNLAWAQELTIILFVWMAKFGAAYGVRTGIHVGVDVLINQLNDRKRGFFIVFGLLAGAFFTGVIGVLGAHLVWENGAQYAWLTWRGLDVGDIPEGPTTPDLEWPTWIVYSAIPLGSFLMCFRFLQVTWSFLRTGELPHHDHGQVAGLEDEAAPPKPGEDDRIYRMDDGLHPHELKEPPLGEAGKDADKEKRS